MKIVLSMGELADAVRNFYPVPAGFTIADVSVSKYGQDFCTIEMERAPDAPATAPVAPPLKDAA